MLVYRLVAKDTVEERILALQERKRASPTPRWAARAAAAAHARRPPRAARLNERPTFADHPGRLTVGSVLFSSFGELVALSETPPRQPRHSAVRRGEAGYSIPSDPVGRQFMADDPQSRRLTTIVALDVAGYSARTEADEARTTAEVAALRRVIEGIATPHGGRVFNTAGDGFMLEFGSSLAAVEAAFALADTCEPKVRVGVHLGDVVVQPNGDLLGHGVNVAARLMARSDPGSVLVSADVRRTIRGPLAERLVSRGSLQLDKMTETIEAFALARRGVGRRRDATPERASRFSPCCPSTTCRMIGRCSSSRTACRRRSSNGCHAAPDEGDRAHVELSVSWCGQDGAQRGEGARVLAHPGRLHPPRGRARAYRGASGGGGLADDPVVGSLRPQPRRHLRRAGRDLRAHRGRPRPDLHELLDQGDRSGGL